MLNTAVDDGIIVRNPCRIAGGGVERSPERPVPTGDEVWALADAIGNRWRTLVLTSAFAGLRWGELMGLQRADIDIDAATITVARQVLEVGSQQIEGPPKTDAGLRTVAGRSMGDGACTGTVTGTVTLVTYMAISIGAAASSLAGGRSHMFPT